MPVRDAGPRPIRNRGDAPVDRPAAPVVNGAPGVDPAARTGDVGATDGVDRSARTSTNRAATITGPYAALAKRGDFSGYVVTASGQELFVTVRVAKNDPGNERPLVYLDGLAARRSRSDMMADKFRDEGGRTVISVLLPGQGETLLRDLQKNRGRSLNNDIKDTHQAQAVVEALDALGVDEPVDIFGLSYGGAIAAATERDHGSRIENVLLVAPHVRSQARDEMGELTWQMMANNPWNPMGNTMYRSAAKSTLAKAFGVPELFKDHPQAFPEALFRLSMGIDKNELDRTTRGSENVHVLVAEGDGASPLAYNQKAVDAAGSGSLTVAPDSFKGQHDLVSASPELVVMWVTAKLNPERADEVNKTLMASMQKRMALQTAQGMVGAAAQVVVESAKKPPAEAALGAAEGAKMAAVAAKAGLDALALVDAGTKRALLESVELAAKIATEAAQLCAAAAEAAPSPEAKAAVKDAQTAASEAQKHAAAAKKLVDG